MSSQPVPWLAATCPHAVLLCDVLQVLMQPAGAALQPSTPLTYEFANRWSATTTWGGAPPPVAGDSVYIPPNITVIMDVSPPELGALVLDGTLKFDMAAPQLDLTAGYILVRVRACLLLPDWCTLCCRQLAASCSLLVPTISTTSLLLLLHSWC